jgi:hypothetical protein
VVVPVEPPEESALEGGPVDVPGPDDPNFQATTTRIVTAMIPARATMTKLDSTARERDGWRAGRAGASGSSSRVKRELNSST